MVTSLSARSILRAATAPDHQKVDSAFSNFDLGSREGYIAFLQAQAFALLPVEGAIDRADPARIVADWHDRRRAALLEADLADLGANIPGTSAFDLPDTAEALLGAVYVLEGSRLGGSLLCRRVPSHFPRHFLSATNPLLWRRLIELLDELLLTDAQVAAAASSAKRVFARFEQGAQHHEKVVRIV